MSELHLPWLEIAIILPLVGALWVRRMTDRERAQTQSVYFLSGSLFAAVAAWVDFAALGTRAAQDSGHWVNRWLGADSLLIDRLSAPLLPLTALLFLVTVLATMRTQAGRFSFWRTLLSASITLALLACKNPWGMIGLMALATVPPLLELRDRGRSTRIFALHMGVFLLLMAGGWLLVSRAPDQASPPILGVALLTAAVLLRSGVVPFHCWITDLFENATFGTSLLFVTPLTGAYAAVRLVLPIAPSWALRSIALWSLTTAVYAASMALVQREARRFFCYLFLSHASLVLVGLETATPLGLTGALAVWLSVGLALTGFGLTLRAMEARTGRISLNSYQGLFDRAPQLGSFFLLTGLASVGFPGTIGFVATELLVEGAVTVYPIVAGLIVLVATLQGIAVVKAYYRLFTGTRSHSSVFLEGRLLEKIAVLALSLLIIGGGLFPQPGIESRFQAAMEIIADRSQRLKEPASRSEHDAVHAARSASSPQVR